MNSLRHHLIRLLTAVSSAVVFAGMPAAAFAVGPYTAYSMNCAETMLKATAPTKDASKALMGLGGITRDLDWTSRQPRPVAFG